MVQMRGGRGLVPLSSIQASVCVSIASSVDQQKSTCSAMCHCAGLDLGRPQSVSVAAGSICIIACAGSSVCQVHQRLAWV